MTDETPNGINREAYYDPDSDGVEVMEVCASCGHEADLQSRDGYNVCPNCSAAFADETPVHKVSGEAR